MVTISKQDIGDREKILFRSCSDFLLTNIGHLESSKFLHVSFLGHLVLFIFWCCLLCKSSEHWAAKLRIWKAMIDRWTFCVFDTVTVSYFISNFRTTVWQTSGAVFLKVSIVYPINVQIFLTAFDLFKIFDLNWLVNVLRRSATFASVFQIQKQILWETWSSRASKIHFIIELI